MGLVVDSQDDVDDLFVEIDGLLMAVNLVEEVEEVGPQYLLLLVGDGVLRMVVPCE